MSSKSPLLLVATGLILACGVGYLLLSDPGQEAHAIAGVDQDETPSIAREPSQLSTPDVIETTRDEAPVALREETPTPKRVSHTDSIWIEGRVVFPGGTPPDESVTVIARGKKFKGKEDDPKKYETEAGQNGRFRVAFAKGTKRGRLSIQAKYLYLEKAIKVSHKSFEEEALIEPLLGGCIEVTLLAPPGTPLSEEEIESCKIGGWTGEDGAGFFAPGARRVEGPLFRLVALEPDSGYELSLESDQFVNSDQSGVDVKPGEITRAEFQLEVGARVVGRVVDRDGQPLAEVQLSFQMPGDWRSEVSDEAGEFDVGGLDEGTLTIATTKSGLLDGEDLVLELVRGESITGLEILMDRGNSISGLVTWPDGTPVADAHVLVEQEPDSGKDRFWGGGSLLSETTDSDGSFTVTGLGGDECVLLARAQPALEPVENESERDRKRRKKAQPYWNVRLERVRPNSGPLTLVLNEGSGIRGVVVDDLGAAIEDFKVVAQSAGKMSWERLPADTVLLKVKDSPGGSFVLEGLKEGAFEVHATARRYKTRARERIEVPWKGGVLTLVVPRVARLSGVVYDLAGQPVADARVEHLYEGESPRAAFIGSSNRADKTDKHGAFLFKSLSHGASQVRATAPGFGSSEWRDVSLEPAQELTGFALQLRAGATVTGVVHPSVGDVAGRTINLEHSGPSDDLETTSDANGEFRFEAVDSGEHELSLEPHMSDMDTEQDGYWLTYQIRSKKVTLELRDGEHKHVILGEPSGTPIVVTGLVSAGGEPIAGELVIAHGSEEHAQDYRELAHTDSEGIYTLTLDGPGHYRFTVGDDWGASISFSRDVPDKESFRCDLELPTASLSGILRGPGGELLSGIAVTLDPQDADDDVSAPAGGAMLGFREAETNKEGRFTFDRLQPANYTLRAGGDDLWGLQTSGKFGREIVGNLKIEAGKAHEDLTIDMSFAGTIKGTVRDAAGSLVPDVDLRIELENGLYLEIWGGHQTDEAGQFTIRGIAPGTVRVIAELEDGSQGEVRADVFSREKTEVELVLN